MFTIVPFTRIARTTRVLLGFSLGTRNSVYVGYLNPTDAPKNRACTYLLSDVVKTAEKKAGNMQKDFSKGSLSACSIRAAQLQHETWHATIGLKACAGLAAVASGYRTSKICNS